MWLGLAIFAAVYALLAVPRLGRRLREAATARWGRWGALATGRPGIALAGALLVVLTLQVAPLDALRAIDLRILALLAGMMLLVAALDAANAFAVLASALTRWLRTPAMLLAGSMLVVAVLSALVLNDAVVLFFTPVLVRAARAMGASPVPFLVGEAIAANLGSAATPTGNPQNAAIAAAREFSFLEFTLPLLPVAALALVLGVGAALAFFWRDLGRARAADAADAPPRARISNVPMLALALAALALALAGFLLGPRVRVPLWLAALGAGAVALALAPAARVSPLALARRVDMGILVFFVGLFVLLETVRASGLLDRMADALATMGSAGFVVGTAVLSNLVSNVPAVLLLLPTVESDAQALLLAAASTFAGNATFLGSAATVIVAETARHEGADFSVLQFTLLGLPLSVATLVLAWGMLG
ncbi:MAG TPA: SLC13 family permease [Candidatus Thermoplasmatota archaeon]|nr:SLC13 family permease [Candidatus Thermoplasmatota archaeon]